MHSGKVTIDCPSRAGAMRLYVRRPAPNALKVEMFALERGVDLELIDAGELPPEQILAMNPLGTVPILELAPGCCISESLTICQFLDEVSPGRRLFGATPLDRARVAMWERRAELRLFEPSIEYAHHTHPAFAGSLRQHPEWARDELAKSEAMLALMTERLEASPFLGGGELSAADLTAYFGYRGLRAFGAVGPVMARGFRRWEEHVGARPSMDPLSRLISQFEVAA